MPERYICIHGHFYQPPRENPWLESIELQDSAYPYHDWNARVTYEAYAPNAASRILDGQNRIVHIMNNYAKTSFDFGPTLLSWMENSAPQTYQAILSADRQSREQFSGHGSAMAQAYNHIIMPLAQRRDKSTQVVWGIKDFEHRFGRKPEGMWLPETAVDLETLDILAEHGIAFTILAPHQAARVRPLGDGAWQDVTGGRVDPTMAYRLWLPSGRAIAVFFYDGAVSQAVAFEQLLSSGDAFSSRLWGAFSEARPWPQLVHIATDGETYGHHHRFGEMALSYALAHIESHQVSRLTNYGEYLDHCPPTHEVGIIENTSWSCAHGVERWRSDCGCNTGHNPSWKQRWRAPLREALDWLRNELAPRYEQHANPLLRDPWQARDEYIQVVLDRSPKTVADFFERHARHPLTGQEKVQALKLLEMQRHAMLMHTSCGWFFDDLSGIETAQVLQYAGRAVQLAQQLGGDGIEERFLQLLERAKSNVAEQRDGRYLYETKVRPAMIDLPKVVAHYAVSSLFEAYGAQTRVFCYQVERQAYSSLEAGKATMAVGLARVTCTITQESGDFSFGVLHLGDHNLSGGVRAFSGQEEYQRMAQEVTASFSRADLPATLRLLDSHFQYLTYSLKSLFRDEQRKVLRQVLSDSLAEAEGVQRQLYQHHAPLMRFLRDVGISAPPAFQAAAEFVLNTDLRRAVLEPEFDVNQVRGLLGEAHLVGVELDKAGIAYALGQTVERLLDALRATPGDPDPVQQLERLVELIQSLPFSVDLWQAQNVYYEVWQTLDEAAQHDDEKAQAWQRSFPALGRRLGFRINSPTA
ncbi:MAG: DUF3536 domain-containing protein [Chloroflexi bacterium]|nr:DUF3536 domain-containing protein [Chloroflexota bacterium]